MRTPKSVSLSRFDMVKVKSRRKRTLESEWLANWRNRLPWFVRDVQHDIAIVQGTSEGEQRREEGSLQNAKGCADQKRGKAASTALTTRVAKMRVQERVRCGCEREVLIQKRKGEVVRSSRVVKVA